MPRKTQERTRTDRLDFCGFSCLSWRIKRTVVVAAVLFLGAVAYADPIQIDFFFEPGCHDCEQIEQDILPELGRRFPDHCVIQRYDIGIETNFLYLLQLEDALGYEGSERGYLIVNKQTVFGSSLDVEELCSVVSNLIGSRSRERVEDTGSPSTGKPVLQSDSRLVEERYRDFTLAAVLIAGLLDGINPCAISTLVFFMSLLSVSTRRRQGYGGQGVRSRQLLIMGFSFCLASFVTYLAIGFGLLRFLHLFAGFSVLRSALEWGMTALLLVFAFLSFRDAVRFRKSGKGVDVTLQLSTGMKKRIHSVMRRGLGTRSIVLGGFFIGTLVTALESVCTGQVYVPTLVLILKDVNLAESRAWVYLLGYNLLFVLPLVLVFTAVYFGLKAETLLAWSRKNVVVSKTLLGLFFVLLAVLFRLF